MTTDFRAMCAELATLAKRKHYYCEDRWYSCPKAEDGCANDSDGEDCNCGADIHNAKVEAIVARALLDQPEPSEPTDEELYELWVQNGFENDRFARAVLARWGRPTPPSEADQALALLNDCADRLDGAHENAIRRALELLKELERTFHE